MTAKRYTASSITDDALDALYENATEGWRRGDRWKERAEQSAAAVERARVIVRRLAAHAVGFQDVLDDVDHGPWGRTVGADITELTAILDGTEQSEETSTK
ncbi:hypothetical protein ACN6K6_000643 [Streptomyces violaceoruber]|uniref:hypothetical protein n=1 Tax=Streptomyces violaceoruber group TaxID=2867121 RepID=UPI00364D2AA9